MPETIEALYPWKRFWCPRDKVISFADDGFVYDPESDFGKIINAELRALDSAQDLRCLILLGEPGLGKSQTLREYHAALKSLNDPSRHIIYLDLKDFGSDAALTRGLFESTTFQEWKAGESRLYLLIDSFDEGLLTIESLAGHLSRELRALAVPQALSASSESSKSAQPAANRTETDDVSVRISVPRSSPVNRLFLRIASRPAVWPSSLTSDLRQIFPESAVDVWNLAPLRKCDVEIAANRIGAPDFAQQVISGGVVPFATKPITLKALLNLYKSKRALLYTKYAMYEELCRVACTESSPSRHERHKLGRLTPQERLSVASRIAALMVFCNRSRLRTDLPLADLACEELPVDVIFGHERQRNSEVVIEHHGLAETLDTTLFTWPKPTSAAWDHRTYSEFLAARYCHGHKMSPKDIGRLIFTASFGEKRVAPQLYETAAWLCGLYPSLRSDVLSCDPMVLLLSDVLRDDPSIRYKVAERYLESFEKEQVFDDQIRDELKLLDHPQLAGQLRPYISGRTKKYRARTKAMDIAAVCQIREVELDLIRVALDSHELLPVRTHALFTIGKYPVSPSRAMLRELITTPCPEDQAHEIKGWTLMALWPSHISAQDLFDALRDPGPSNFLGGYASLLNRLSREIPSTLKEADLETALGWVEGLGIDRATNRLTAVADAVLLRAWDCLPNPAILDPFTRIVLKFIENHVPIAQSDDLYRPGEKRRFYELLTGDATRRRLLIRSLVHHLATGPGFPTFRLIFCEDRIVRTADTGWLIDLLPTCLPAERRVIESLLESMPDDDAQSLDGIRRAVEEGRLPLEYGTRLYIDLSSELAATRRRDYEEYNPPPKQRKLLVPSPRDRVFEFLGQMRSGRLDSWGWLIKTLTLEEDSAYYGEERDDLRKLPGWISADENLRKEIVLAAQRFLVEYKPTPAEYSQQIFGHWIIAAYLAFTLLHDESMAFLQTQGEEFWNRWTGLLLSYRFDNDRGIDRKLLTLVAKCCPTALSAGLAEVLSPTLEDCYFLTKLSGAWGPQVEEHLMRVLKEGGLKSRCSDVILALLLDKGSAGAEDFAISMTRAADDANRQVRGAVALLKHSPSKSEEIVWPLIRNSDALGQRIIESASDFGGGIFLPSWSDTAIGELYVWMAKKYPDSGTTVRTESPSLVGTAEAVRFLRDALLTQLRGRGTPEAVEALRKAGKALKADWMKWHVVEAKNAAFRREWKPAKPSYVLSLAEQAEFLTPLQQTLHGAAVLAVVLSVLANTLTPANLSNGTRAFLATGLALSAVVLLETANSKRTFWLPFWITLLVSDAAGYLLFRFLR